MANKRKKVSGDAITIAKMQSTLRYQNSKNESILCNARTVFYPLLPIYCFTGFDINIFQLYGL